MNDPKRHVGPVEVEMLAPGAGGVAEMALIVHFGAGGPGRHGDAIDSWGQNPKTAQGDQGRCRSGWWAGGRSGSWRDHHHEEIVTRGPQAVNGVS